MVIMGSNVYISFTYGIYGVPNENLLDLKFLLVYFRKVLSSVIERQQSSNAFSKEEYIPRIMTVL